MSGFLDPRRLEGEIAQIFDTLGGELNASTSREYVVVYGRFLDDQLKFALDVMTDMLLTPSFADLDHEREVVLEEIAMVEDSPSDLIHDILSEVVLDSHPLAHPILGSRESIAGASEESIRAFHHDHFRFSDMVVAAAGNIDHDELRELLMRDHPLPSRCMSAWAAWDWRGTTRDGSCFPSWTACSVDR